LLSKDVKNTYGRLEAEATFKGVKARNATENKRPFILTRSSFFGN